MIDRRANSPLNLLGGELRSPASGTTTHLSSTRPSVDKKPETSLPSANNDTTSPMCKNGAGSDVDLLGM